MICFITISNWLPCKQDELLDFKMAAPYVPESKKYMKNLMDTMEPYNNNIKVEKEAPFIYNIEDEEENEFYNKNWDRDF